MPQALRPSRHRPSCVTTGYAVSHTLPDVFAVTNRIVVMHRGRRAAEKRTSETNSREIVQYMVGALDDSRVS
jgi:ABC-type sugar transport system ATPase subunit